MSYAFMVMCFCAPHRNFSFQEIIKYSEFEFLNLPYFLELTSFQPMHTQGKKSESLEKRPYVGLISRT